MLLVVTISARSPIDADVWWHIRSGETTLKSGSPLMVDPFSFTRNGAPWTNHSWLAQVILFLAFNFGGYLGLGIFTAVLAVISMALVYRMVEGPPLLKAFLVIFCSAASALIWTPRPQMFSLVLFIGLCTVLHLYRQTRKKILWLIPVLFVIWSNLHGGFPLGLILLAAFLAGEIGSHIFLYSPEECLPWTEIRKIALWSASAIPAILINPNGIKTWLIPFQTVGVTALQNLIQEWASPDFHVLSQQVILWLFFFLFISFSTAGRRMPMTDIVIPVVFAYMTFLARRNIGAFAMVTVLALSRGILYSWQMWRIKFTPDQKIYQFFKSKNFSQFTSEDQNLSPKISRVLNLIIIGFLGAIAFGRLGIMTLKPVVAHFMENDYPVGAVEWLQENPTSGNMLNEYNWGGYLIFTNPQNQVFVDGRTDLYGDDIIGQWQKAVLGDPEWKSIFEKWDVRLVLLQPDRPVIAILKNNGWQMVYEDTKSVLLEKK